MIAPPNPAMHLRSWHTLVSGLNRSVSTGSSGTVPYTTYAVFWCLRSFHYLTFQKLFGLITFVEVFLYTSHSLDTAEMDRRYGDDQDEKVELDTYRYHSNNSFEHPTPFAPSPLSPRALTPVRPGHFPTDEDGQPIWLQPAARMSGHSDSINGSPWSTQTPYDSRSGSPTFVSGVLFWS